MAGGGGRVRTMTVDSQEVNAADLISISGNRITFPPIRILSSVLPPIFSKM